MAAVKLAQQDVSHHIKPAVFVSVFFKIRCRPGTTKTTTKTWRMQVIETTASPSSKPCFATSLDQFMQIFAASSSPSNRAGHVNVFWCQKLNLSSIKSSVNGGVEVNVQHLPWGGGARGLESS